MRQDVFGTVLELQSPQDFSFVLRYGVPFSVEAAGSEVRFGVDSPQHGRLLIRFAGAPLAGTAEPQEAAIVLAEAMPAYEALYPHPALIKLQGHGAVAEGYAAIFRWPAGESLRAEGALRRLQRQPLLSRLRMIDPIFDFHAYAEAQGWQPVGFYDGSLAADGETGRLLLTDIDLYRPAPAYNDRGRMPGSSRFLSPEEYVPGAPLDGLTAQYTMGALAFALFADHGSRERGAWMAGAPLYQVAARACAEERAERFSSYAAFLAAWREAAGETVG